MNDVTYSIRISDLHRVEGGLICGDEAVVSVMDNGREIHRERFIGKCTSPGGYTRKYPGKPGLTAALISGNCRMDFSLSSHPKGTPRRP